MLVNRSTGAVGYLGCVTGSQYGSEIDKAFFESMFYYPNTLGGMWRLMVILYYQWYPDPGYLGSPHWSVPAKFHHPWKFHLFGDPSLRIDGVPRLLYLPLVGRCLWPRTD